jgi:hypothetical protein
MRHALFASLTSSQARLLVQRAACLTGFMGALPTRLVVDGKRSTPTSQWKEELGAAETNSRVYWHDARQQLGILPRSDLVVLGLLDAFESDADVRSMLEPLPFEICTLGSVFWDEWIAAGYRRWALGRSHLDHGWGCVFRGPGHDRLMSRRWLDFGPWRAVRRPNDTTFVQFHDLAITDPAEAYAQAAPGHQRIGIDPIGGFIQGIDLDVIAQVRGLYRAETHTLEVDVAQGASVSQQDMRVACGLRLHDRLTHPAVERVDHIAYVFMDKGDATAHLHELWLRELECWYIDERGKHRLDAEYHPTPVPPAWVKALDGKALDE